VLCSPAIYHCPH